MTRDNDAWQKLEADIGVTVQSDGTPFPKDKNRYFADDVTRTKALAAELSKKMSCNCDLDRWQPESYTGHSWVCRIHKATMRMATNR